MTQACNAKLGTCGFSVSEFRWHRENKPKCSNNYYCQILSQETVRTRCAKSSWEAAIEDGDLRHFVLDGRAGHQRVNFSSFVSMCAIGLHQSCQAMVCLGKSDSQSNVNDYKHYGKTLNLEKHLITSFPALADIYNNRHTNSRYIRP